ADASSSLASAAAPSRTGAPMRGIAAVENGPAWPAGAAGGGAPPPPPPGRGGRARAPVRGGRWRRRRCWPGGATPLEPPAGLGPHSFVTRPGPCLPGGATPLEPPAGLGPPSLVTPPRPRFAGG